MKKHKKIKRSGFNKENFNVKISLLPDSLIKKGLQSTWGIPNSMDRLTGILKTNQQKLHRLQAKYNTLRQKADKKELRVLNETLGKEIKFLKSDIKRTKADIKNFKIDHFHAWDVEKAFVDNFSYVKEKRNKKELHESWLYYYKLIKKIVKSKILTEREESDLKTLLSELMSEQQYGKDNYGDSLYYKLL